MNPGGAPASGLTLPTADDVAAGAASVAAAMAGQRGKGNILCIVSGGSIDAPKHGAILNGQSPR